MEDLTAIFVLWNMLRVRADLILDIRINSTFDYDSSQLTTDQAYQAAVKGDMRLVKAMMEKSLSESYIVEGDLKFHYDGRFIVNDSYCFKASIPKPQHVIRGTAHLKCAKESSFSRPVDMIKPKLEKFLKEETKMLKMAICRDFENSTWTCTNNCTITELCDHIDVKGNLTVKLKLEIRILLKYMNTAAKGLLVLGIGANIAVSCLRLKAVLSIDTRHLIPSEPESPTPVPSTLIGPRPPPNLPSNVRWIP